MSALPGSGLEVPGITQTFFLCGCFSKEAVPWAALPWCFVSKAIGHPSLSMGSVQFPDMAADMALCSYSLQEKGGTMSSQGQTGQEFHVFAVLVPYTGKTQKALDEGCICLTLTCACE